MVDLPKDLIKAINNRDEGIIEYLSSQGDIFVSPYGIFNTMSEIARVSGEYKTTVLRRINSNKPEFQNWYVIRCDSELRPAESCIYTDTVDNILFSANCWLSHIENHLYGNPINDDSIVVYLYKGEEYKVSYKDFINNVKPHKEI